MMAKNTDVLVIGAGLSGMMAAATASRQGKRVVVAARGMGVVGLSSGCIDLWGYSPELPGEVSRNPLEDIGLMIKANPGHPYARVASVLGESIDFFKSICSAGGYPYVGDGGNNWLLPTALGTLRPTCLAPASMAVGPLEDYKKIVVVGFAELKDFHPRVMAANLGRNAGLPGDIVVEPVTVRAGGGEPGAAALARRLEKEKGIIEGVVDQVRPFMSPGCAALFPPVLGERPGSGVLPGLAGGLGCAVYEVAGAPPSLPGLRLQEVLMGHLKKSGVEVIPGCAVMECAIDGGHCLEVYSPAGSGIRIAAETFVLATGSFLGGGLEASPGEIRETVFNIAVKADSPHWSEKEFLSPGGHPFSKFGIAVNDRLQPVDERGRVLLENVMVVGSNLAGCNYPVEKCGNGVAVATGYAAGKLAGRCPG